jgi:hypothetical protein
MNHRLHWRLVIGLAVFHLLLLAVVYYIPIWIGGKGALYHRWSQHTTGSLSGAQYSLLISFWAISRCNWSKRTVLLIAGLVALTLVRVAILFPLTKSNDSPVKILWNLLLNQTDVFVGNALVLAVFLELLRPVWGVLSQEPPERPEHLTIFALFRLTTIAAIAAILLKISGSFLDDSIWYASQWLLDATLLASCIWMMFAPRYAWVGVAGCVAVMVGGVLNTPAEITAKYGPWYWLPSLCLNTIWICSTHLVVRYFGFRMRKRSLQRTAPLPDRLLAQSA